MQTRATKRRPRSESVVKPSPIIAAITARGCTVWPRPMVGLVRDVQSNDVFANRVDSFFTTRVEQSS